MVSKKKINKEASAVVIATTPGSMDAQIVRLTDRINRLNEHFTTAKKDYSSMRGLLMLVGQRRRFLDYVLRHDRARYEALIEQLGLRK